MEGNKALHSDNPAIEEFSNMRSRLCQIFVSFIKFKGPHNVDKLFEVAVSALPKNSFNHVFTSTEGLVTFLKTYKNVFHAQSDLVSLVDPHVKIEPIHKIHCNEYVKTELFKTKVLQSTRVIVNVMEGSEAIIDILSQVRRGIFKAVAVDCEGVNLGPTGQVTSVQVGLVTGQAFIFDIVECQRLIFEGGLKRLLESEDVVKVIHASEGDCANLYNQFGVKLVNVFDTQVAHSTLEHIRTGFQGNYASLNAVCAAYGAPQNPLKDKFKKMYKRNQRFWAVRPFTEDMLLYSAADVVGLVHVYDAMIKLLKEHLTPGSNYALRPEQLPLLRYLGLTDFERLRFEKASIAKFGHLVIRSVTERRRRQRERRKEERKKKLCAPSVPSWKRVKAEKGKVEKRKVKIRKGLHS